jgi:hypothetical protein
MKTSELKKIVVKSGKHWMDEYEIDSTIFDDVYLEAATRAIEKRKDMLSKLRLGAILVCWEKRDFKRPERHFCYNSYYILVNAGLHKTAEIYRANFLKMYGRDMKKESLKENGAPTEQSENISKLPNTGSAEY